MDQESRPGGPRGGGKRGSRCDGDEKGPRLEGKREEAGTGRALDVGLRSFTIVDTKSERAACGKAGGDVGLQPPGANDHRCLIEPGRWASIVGDRDPERLGFAIARAEEPERGRAPEDGAGEAELENFIAARAVPRAAPHAVALLRHHSDAQRKLEPAVRHAPRLEVALPENTAAREFLDDGQRFTLPHHALRSTTVEAAACTRGPTLHFARRRRCRSALD